MRITKKVIAPLIIMIILAGAAGIMSAKEIAYQRMQDIQRISDSKKDDKQLPNDIKFRKQQ